MNNFLLIMIFIKISSFCLRNVLLDQFSRAKVANFGLQSLNLEESEPPERWMAGRWMAPETLFDKKRTSR